MTMCVGVEFGSAITMSVSGVESGDFGGDVPVTTKLNPMEAAVNS